MTTVAQPSVVDAAPYLPATLTVDYPDRVLNRWSTAFRIVWAIPILLVVAAVTRGAGPAGGLLVLPPLFMLVARGKYPSWWFAWNVELVRFTTRVVAYLALMDDRYPSTDEQQSVHVDLVDPGRHPTLDRRLPLVKWLLVLPHLVALVFLGVAAVLAVIAAWFAILASGRYPRGLFAFVEGVMRWSLRVNAYAFLLTTDEYPPFRFGA